MDKKKSGLFALTFGSALLAVGFLVASLATDYWLVSHPVRIVGNETQEAAQEVSDGESDTKFTGYIHFGLFHGSKSLDYGFGMRTSDIYVSCVPSHGVCGCVVDQDTAADDLLAFIELSSETSNSSSSDDTVTDYARDGLFSFGLWVATVVCVVLGIVWGLVSMGFAVLNATTRPIETITGPMGLYLWNSLALLFSLVAFLLYLTLFVTELSENVLTPEDLLDASTYQFTSDGRSYLWYSFYFVVVATGLFLLNVILVFIAGAQCKVQRYSADVNDKAMDGVMMY